MSHTKIFSSFSGQRKLTKASKYAYGLLVSSLVFLLTFYILSCSEKKELPTEPEPNRPGYQEDIPWPSLADSPWPIEHGDPQNTGRSKYPGPKLGVINKIIDSIYSNTGVVIGHDSTLYFACQSELKAYSLVGTLKWKIPFSSETLSTPIVGYDGTIYCLYLYELVAVNPDGTIKWKFPVSALNSGGMNIGKDGTLYFADSGDKTLYAVSKEGRLLWTLTDEKITGWNPPVLSPDGKTIYLPGDGVTLVAVDAENQNIKWTFGNIFSGHGPVIDSDGNIYLYSNQLINGDELSGIFSLSSKSAIRWIFETEQEPLNAMTIDINGNIIFGSDTLYSLSYSGQLNWFLPIEDFISSRGLVCDANSNLFIITSNFPPMGFSLSCLLSSGEELFKVDGLNGFSPNKPPALLFELIILPTEESNLSYIIE